MTYQSLYDYLDPNLQKEFAQNHTLQPEVRATLAMKLRRELAACAAYIPLRLLRARLTDPKPGRMSGSFWR